MEKCFIPLSILAVLTMGCEEASSSSPEGWDHTGTAPDFQLEDVNTTSVSFGEVVSPRDQMESVSGWYFAHAT